MDPQAGHRLASPFSHPSKPGLVTVAGKPSATLKPKTEASILRQAGLRRERH
ncbi:MAG: type II toxin-antitoxin system HicA family toxin [Pseudonocardiaceae bacterium]